MLGFAITNKKVCIDAAQKEIVRRHFAALKDVFLGKYDNDIVAKSEMLMNQVNVKVDYRVSVKACMEKQAKTKTNCMAIEVNKKLMVTGKESKDLTASSAAIINALKALGKIDHNIPLIQPLVLESVKKMKQSSHGYESKLSVSETLTCLAIQSLTNPLASLAIKQLPLLRTAQAHSSCLLKPGELASLKKLGIDVTEQAASYISTKFHIRKA